MFVLLYGHDRHVLHQASSHLHTHADISVLAVTTSPQELFRLAPLCELAVLDYDVHPDMPSVIRHLAPLLSPTRIVLLNVPDDPMQLIQCLKAGAFAYLRPSDAAETQRTVLKEAAAGSIRLDAPLARAILEHYRVRQRGAVDREDDRPGASERRRQVGRHLDH